MNFGNSTNIAIATAVWQNSPRTLTGFGTAVTLAQVQNGSLASSTSLTIAPTGVAAVIGLGVLAGAAGNSTLNINDGTRSYTLLTVATGTNGATPCVVISAFIIFSLANNDAANAARYGYNLMNFNQ